MKQIWCWWGNDDWEGENDENKEDTEKGDDGRESIGADIAQTLTRPVTDDGRDKFNSSHNVSYSTCMRAKSSIWKQRKTNCITEICKETSITLKGEFSQITMKTCCSSMSSIISVGDNQLIWSKAQKTTEFYCTLLWDALLSTTVYQVRDELWTHNLHHHQQNIFMTQGQTPSADEDHVIQSKATKQTKLRWDFFFLLEKLQCNKN